MPTTDGNSEAHWSRCGYLRKTDLSGEISKLGCVKALISKLNKCSLPIRWVEGQSGGSLEGGSRWIRDLLKFL